MATHCSIPSRWRSIEVWPAHGKVPAAKKLLFERDDLRDLVGEDLKTTLLVGTKWDHSDSGASYRAC
jgi:hypothetical protein